MFTALVATLLTLPIAAPPEAEKRMGPDQTIVRVDAATWEGEFTAKVVPIADTQSVRVTLTGTMTNKSPDDEPYPATIVLSCPVAKDMVVGSGETRLVRGDDVAQVYLVENLAPDATLWSSRTSADFGSMEVWNATDQARRLSESVIVSLFNTMVLDRPTLGGRSAACDPTFDDCRSSASAACSPNRLGSLTYKCDEGAVECSWTCLAPVPDPD